MTSLPYEGATPKPDKRKGGNGIATSLMIVLYKINIFEVKPVIESLLN